MDLLKSEEPVRTDMNCNECNKNFVAQLDHAIDGNHVVECPYCGHDHFRVIKDGVVTEERHQSGLPTTKVASRCVWKHDSQPMITSTASAFIRDKWLNRGDW